MKVTVTARHADFTEAIKDYAYEKARRLERYFDALRKLEVILDADSDGRYSAEMIASAVRGHVLVCHSLQDNAMAAIDAVVDKMERQLTKLKEKLRDKHAKEETKEARSRRNPPELVAGDQVGDLWW
ncbi:MAG: ribosome hibernation-promoting factor, HPF/YfiA family [Planctomycetota bacterium]